MLEGDELALAAGLHNALFLVHPRAELWSVSDRQRRRIIDTALALVSQPLTRNRTRVMARHALLHNLFHLTRSDVTVSWWTGRARFQGQKPPARLTAWSGVRRVREDVTVVDFDELLAVPDTAPVIATLLRRTPLTQLLDSHPGAPPLHWEDAVFLLRDAELARAVAYRLVPDAPPRDQVVGPARLAAAFEQMLERAPDEADVRAVAAFLVHLERAVLLRRARPARAGREEPADLDGARRRGGGPAPARPRDPVRAARRARARRSAARDAARASTRIPALAARWKVHRAQTAELLSDAVIDALAARLRRHLVPGATRDPAEVVELG